MNKKHICIYCDKSFDTGQKLGGHITRCLLNPNAKIYITQVAKSKIKKRKL